MPRAEVDVQNREIRGRRNGVRLVNDCAPKVRDEAVEIADDLERGRLRGREKDRERPTERLKVLLRTPEARPDPGRDVALAAEVGEGCEERRGAGGGHARARALGSQPFASAS